MDAISSGMNSVARDVMRTADVRQTQPSQQGNQVERPERPNEAAVAAAGAQQQSAVVTLSDVARGESAMQAVPSPDNGTQEAQAVEQARAAAANGDVRVCQIYEGASDIQKLVIGRALVG